MKIACLFPGQGSQYPGMGKKLYEKSSDTKQLFALANKTLGYDITAMMIEGTEEDLQQTAIAQPAIFLYSIIEAFTTPNFYPDFVAGHSLGELSALTASQYLSFEDGLKLVDQRAKAMQKVCSKKKGTMAAVLGLDDRIVEKICHKVGKKEVMPANYNCPGQLVIAGSLEGIKKASEKLSKAGAKKIIPLKVDGAFHSSFMKPATCYLEKVMLETVFLQRKTAIYQNVDAKPTQDKKQIKKNLMLQIFSPVLWTKTIQNMIKNQCHKFIIYGPGNVLHSFVKKIDNSVEIKKIEEILE